MFALAARRVLLRQAKTVTRSYAATPQVATSSDGTKIAYNTSSGTGTPTLLINGWAGCAADWGSVVDRLGEGGRNVVTFDPRSFGASGDGAASMRDLTEDTLAVARAVGSSQAPVDVIGWSLGGLVAQELCCIAPSEVNRAVFASTSPGGEDLAELISRDFFDVFDGWTDDASPEGEATRRRAAAAALVIASPERWVAQNVDALKADVDAFVGQRRAAAAIAAQKQCALAKFPDCARLPKKQYLVLHGDADPIVDASLAPRLAERVPGARLLLLAGVGHRAWAQEPEEWCARVLDFLDAKV